MDRKKACEKLGKTLVYCITYAVPLGDEREEDFLDYLREFGAAEINDVKLLDTKFDDLGSLDKMSQFTERTTREKK
jgi:hypothetical protein